MSFTSSDMPVSSFGAAFSPGDGSLSAAAFGNALFEKCQKTGVRFLFQHEATQLLSSRAGGFHRILGVVTRSPTRTLTVRAKAVLVAAGKETRGLVASLGPGNVLPCFNRFVEGGTVTIKHVPSVPHPMPPPVLLNILPSPPPPSSPAFVGADGGLSSRRTPHMPFPLMQGMTSSLPSHMPPTTTSTATTECQLDARPVLKTPLPVIMDLSRTEKCECFNLVQIDEHTCRLWFQFLC